MENKFSSKDYDYYQQLDKPAKENRKKDNKSKSEPLNKTQLPVGIHKLTGLEPNQYYKPVGDKRGNVYFLLTGEAFYKGQIGVCVSIFDINSKIKLNKIEKQLQALLERYELEDVNFPDICGKKNTLGDKRHSFLVRFTNIVSEIPFRCVAYSVNKSVLFEKFGNDKLPNHDLYARIYNDLLKDVLLDYREGSVFHMCKKFEEDVDKEGNDWFFKDSSPLAHRVVDKTNKNYSFALDLYHYSRSTLLLNLSAEFVAYATNKIQYKIDKSMPRKVIMKEYMILFQMLKKIVARRDKLSSKDLVTMVRKVRRFV